MYALHRRFGLAVPLALVALVALGDLGRLLGPADAGATANYLFGWLAVHQLGFAWHDARVARTRPRRGRRARRVAGPATGAGAAARRAGHAAAADLARAVPGGMLNVPGERLDNAAPPSLALLAVATAQLGLILLLRTAEPRLRRAGPWQLVIAVNWWC